MTTVDAKLEIRPVPNDLRAAAFTLLLADAQGDNSPRLAANMLTAADRGEISLRTMLVATRGSQLAGVVWGQCMPGNTALLWPPRLAHSQDAAVADALQSQIDALLQAAEVRLAQAILGTRGSADAALLSRHGYDLAVELLYLVSPLRHLAGAEQEQDLKFEPYRTDQRDRLIQLIEQTYLGTLDAPALDGVRRMNDVVDGYQQTGEFDPERWFFVRDGQHDIGCLLLADHPQQNHWELVYMGLIPKARGRGWGCRITRHAQRLAQQAGRERLVLAVDSTNDPAISAYTRAGFLESCRRTILLKVFNPPPANSQPSAIAD